MASGYRYRLAVLVLAAAPMVAAASASAQIAFVRGPQIPVSREQPVFATIADMNNDGIGDIIVTSSAPDHNVAVLLGPNFNEVVTTVGSDPRKVVTLDFNADGRQDIALVDRRLSRMFALSGRGTGALNAPGIELFRGAETLATGNFDRRNGPDLVSVNGGRGSVTVLYNTGTGMFRSSGEMALGSTLQEVGTGDFNGDGYDDLAVLDDDLRSVIIALNRNGIFAGATALYPIDSLNLLALSVNDFNGDGAPDIAVLTTGGLTLDRIAVTVLLNRTDPTTGGGTGSFDQLFPLDVRCPVRLNGLPILCRVHDLKTADFNGDGLIDLAVSLAPQLEPGVVAIYAGLGDGTFDYVMQQPVGLQPRGLAVGDVTGDGLPDIVVTEWVDGTVTILQSVGTTLRPLGAACSAASECASGACVDGACCNTAVCPTAQRCDIDGGKGQCNPLAINGNLCTLPGQCTSGFCTDSVCCDTEVCPSGQVCNRPDDKGHCLAVPTPTMPLPTATESVPTATVPAPTMTVPMPTVTPTSTAPVGTTPTIVVLACVGDCNSDQSVAVDELVTVVNVATGNIDLSECLAADASADGVVTVDEIVTSVQNALNGCRSGLIATFDFRTGTNGWVAGFADYDSTQELTYELDEGLRSLPPEIGSGDTGYYLRGNNHSDDLFMFLKRRLGPDDGVRPDQDYRVTFTIQLASNARSGCSGIGGAPGESVFLKAGAGAAEPLAVVTSDLSVRVNVDKGSQGEGGAAASVVGTIANGVACDTPTPLRYVSLQRSHTQDVTVHSAPDGTLWLLVGTDSGFEGVTALYYQSIAVELQPL